MVHLVSMHSNFLGYGFGLGQNTLVHSFVGRHDIGLCYAVDYSECMLLNTQLRDFNNQRTRYIFPDVHPYAYIYNIKIRIVIELVCKKNSFSLGLTCHLLQNPFTNFNVHWVQY